MGRSRAPPALCSRMLVEHLGIKGTSVELRLHFAWGVTCELLGHASGTRKILLTHTVGGCNADSVACSCGCGSAPSRLSPGGTAIIGPGQMPANAGGIVALSPVSSPPWPMASHRWTRLRPRLCRTLIQITKSFQQNTTRKSAPRTWRNRLNWNACGLTSISSWNP